MLQAVLGNATGALAITDGIPLLWLVAIGIWHRRLDLIALVAAGVFGIALAASIAFGGSALPLELRRSVFPGAVGLACLIPLAVGQPLLVVAARVASYAIIGSGLLVAAVYVRWQRSRFTNRA